jgi:hypothetical protein
MWTTQLLFDFTDNEAALDRLIEYLVNQQICVYYSFTGFGEPALFTVLLSPENDTDAIYLSMFECCIGISKVENLKAI